MMEIIELEHLGMSFKDLKTEEQLIEKANYGVEFGGNWLTEYKYTGKHMLRELL
jgi:hypothetical protein